MSRVIEIEFLNGPADGGRVTIPLRRALPRRIWVTATVGGDPPAVEVHAWQLWTTAREFSAAYDLASSDPNRAVYRAARDRVPQNSP